MTTETRANRSDALRVALGVAAGAPAVILVFFGIFSSIHFTHVSLSIGRLVVSVLALLGVLIGVDAFRKTAGISRVLSIAVAAVHALAYGTLFFWFGGMSR